MWKLEPQVFGCIIIDGMFDLLPSCVGVATSHPSTFFLPPLSLSSLMSSPQSRKAFATNEVTRKSQVLDVRGSFLVHLHIGYSESV